MLIRCSRCGQLLCENPEEDYQTELEAPVMVDYMPYCPDCMKMFGEVACEKVHHLLESFTTAHLAALAQQGGKAWGDLYTEMIEEWEQ